MASRILTSRVVAKSLKVSDRRVRQLAKELKLEPQKIGNALVFSTLDLKQMKGRNKIVGRRKLEKNQL